MKNLSKATILIFISFYLTISANASDSSNFELQQFYYKKGYKDAGEKYYKKGYMQAIRDIKKELLKFKARHDAIEASKYLSFTGKITYPEVMKIKDGEGEYKIVILPPRVEKAFSVYDLANIPDGTILKDDKKYKKEISDSTGQMNTKNSFYGQNETSPKGIITKPTAGKEVYLILDKNKNTRTILDTASVSYTEDNKNYKVIFESEFAKKVFCDGIGSKLCK